MPAMGWEGASCGDIERAETLFTRSVFSRWITAYRRTSVVQQDQD